MLPDGSLPGESKRELVTLLAQAFSTPTDLNLLTDFYLNKKLSEITTAETDIQSLVLTVVDWCPAQGGDVLAQLVRGAVKERPQHAALRALAERLGFIVPDTKQLLADLIQLDDAHWPALLA